MLKHSFLQFWWEICTEHIYILYSNCSVSALCLLHSNSTRYTVYSFRFSRLLVKEDFIFNSFYQVRVKNQRDNFNFKDLNIYNFVCI